MKIASTARLPQSLKIDRFVAAACGLVLMLLLTAGAVGYAGLGASSSPVVGVVAGAVDSDSFPAPTAPLVLIGVLLVAVLVAPHRNQTGPAARLIANNRTTI